MDEEQERKHEEAWERYMSAERRDLELRRNGLLVRLLSVLLSEESRMSSSGWREKTSARPRKGS